MNKLRKEGSVARGEELPKVTILLASVILLRNIIPYYYTQFREIFRLFLGKNLDMTLDKQNAYSTFLWVMIKFSLIVAPFMVTIMFVGYMTQRLQVGKLWTFKPMKPKFGKMFNLMNGVKKLMVSPQAMVKLAKSFFIALVVGIAPYLVIKQEFPNLLPLFYANTTQITITILRLAYKMVCYALVPMALIAIADLWYNRWKFSEDSKMSKDEVKDERKQAEGDPVIKNQQRAKMMKFMAQRMMEQVPKADVVVTNPTHYAVALRYDVMEAPAPQVLAKGVNAVAEKIKEIARENKVPIRENKPLAQALYKQVEIGETIPEELYQAVATILAQLEKFKRR